MKGQAEVLAVVRHLVSVENAGDPTIAGIQAAVPDLHRMDWINRFGPADAWVEIVSDLSTKTLEGLIKSLVVAEREFEWSGGSVAAPILLFRAYSARSDADADALADWALRNRGRNNYIPFGRMTSARSLEEWQNEQQLRAEWRELRRLSVQEQKKAKRVRAEQSVVRSAERRQASEARHTEIQARIEQLRCLDSITRLSRMATDRALPLEVIPITLILECIPSTASLDDETRQALLRQIDRRQGRVWKELRIALMA